MRFLSIATFVIAIVRWPLPPALALWICAATSSAVAQIAPPPAYYDPAIGQTGTALKSALHEIIKGHIVLPYAGTGTDTWTALKGLDEDPASASSVVLV